MLAELLVGFDPPAMLEGLQARTRRSRWVTVIGPAGSGKSTLLTGLASPARCVGLVPEGFVRALVYLDQTTTVVSLAHELAAQLRNIVPGYPAAAEEHQQASGSGWFEQDSFTREVTGPLARVHAGPVRLVLDGVDQLQGVAAGDIQQALIAVTQDPALASVRPVISARAVEEWMPDGVPMLVPSPDPLVLSRYLQGRRVPPESAVPLAGLCARGDSAWLLARLVGDTHDGLGQRDRDKLAARLAEPGGRPGALAMLYDRLLDAVGAADPRVWAEQLRPILTPVAAAGAGPVMPLALLTAVSAHFGGPGDPPAVREVLDRLGRLVVRATAGSDGELVGLFHPTLVEHLGGHGRHRVDVISGRRVLLGEVEKLAPVTGIYMDNPLYRWASESEAEHLWQLGLIWRSLVSIYRRPLPTPRQNLERWVGWNDRVRKERGAQHPDTLITRAEIADWTGEVGDAAAAVPGTAARPAAGARALASGDPPHPQQHRHLDGEGR